MRKILIGIQARSHSTRLPFKIYKEISPGVSLLQSCYKRALGAEADNIETYVCVLGHESDTVLQMYCLEKGLNYMCKGLEDDVLGRFLKGECHDCLDGYDAIVRVTSDCPLIPSSMIKDIMVGLDGADYCTNVNPRTFPDGFDCQGMSDRALRWWAMQDYNREHMFMELDTDDPLTRDSFIAQGFKVRRLVSSDKFILNPYHPDCKVSVDIEEDLARVRAIVRDGDASWFVKK